MKYIWNVLHTIKENMQLNMKPLVVIDSTNSQTTFVQQRGPEMFQLKDLFTAQDAVKTSSNL